jgi:hypothetical protein
MSNDIVTFGFEVALASLKKGLKVSRLAFTNKEYLIIEDNMIKIDVGNHNLLPFGADSEFLLSSDWYLYLEPETVKIPEQETLKTVDPNLVEQAEKIKKDYEFKRGSMNV